PLLKVRYHFSATRSQRGRVAAHSNGFCQGALLPGLLIQINEGGSARRDRSDPYRTHTATMHASAPAKAPDQHPFVTRLLQHVDLDADDMKGLNAIIEDDLSIRRRNDLIVDGYEYRKLSFVKEGYAVRYKLLRNGKRQILNVVLPGDIVG